MRQLRQGAVRPHVQSQVAREVVRVRADVEFVWAVEGSCAVEKAQHERGCSVAVHVWHISVSRRRDSYRYVVVQPP